ncbi:hypothetical protein KI387_018650, partial [Taxus chinensis]
FAYFWPARPNCFWAPCTDFARSGRFGHYASICSTRPECYPLQQLANFSPRLDRLFALAAYFCPTCPICFVGRLDSFRPVR